MRPVVIAGATRTAVAPRNGAFKTIEPTELAAAAIGGLLADTGCDPAWVASIRLGNALYGGGNPARVAALAAGLPAASAALTIDSQCCSGLDAIMLAAAEVATGDADAVIAGGLESFSRAPIRQTRPRRPDEAPRAYRRPPFTPWPDRDPDMIVAAATVARERAITRDRQAAFACLSHATALATGPADAEIVPVAGLARDAFARRLKPALCGRLPTLAGDHAFGPTAATVAVEADAAAVVLLVAAPLRDRLRPVRQPVRYLAGRRGGGDPERPAVAPIAVAAELLRTCGIAPDDLALAEIMEAFAAQAIAMIDALGLPPDRVNRGGGALARGHPIGASGAILAVRLWHELQREPPGARGLAAIAAAGGLGSALVLET